MRLNLDEHLSVGGPIAEADPLPPENRLPASPREELDLLYRTNWRKLLRFVRRRSAPERAHDIVQELFARLVARAERSGKGPAIVAPDAYLQQAARNLLGTEARDAGRRSAHLHLCADDVPLATHDPVAMLEARDMLRRVEAAVARLPPRTREIFLAHRLDGYSYGEIAQRSGLSVKTVEMHMSCAIAYLGRQFRP